MHRTSAVPSHKRVAHRSTAAVDRFFTRGTALATLQRFVGNVAVARMLALQRDADPNQGWSDTTKGWNAKRQTVEDIDRIPISDLGDFGIDHKGLTDEERKTDSKHHTTEAAGHRCIALVPKADR